MVWLLALIAALICWLGHMLYQSCLQVRKGKSGCEGFVFVFMGGQPEVAEWFLRNISRADGILTGRLAVAVAVEDSADDTAGIAGILARKSGFKLVDPREWKAGGLYSPPETWSFDVRGITSIDQLMAPARTITAL